jgi:hypothetical protein
MGTKVSIVMNGIKNDHLENRKQTQEKESRVRIQFLIVVLHPNVILITFLSFRVIKLAVCWSESDKKRRYFASVMMHAQC